MRLYLGRIYYPVTSLGPGRRSGIWVQGCSRRCPGCMSPELLTPKSSSLCSVEGVFAEILKVASVCDGITISGGEPFEQAAPLAELCSLIKEYTSLDIMIYSGYTIDEIRAGTDDMNQLLQTADILIDGPFRLELPTRKLWRGSDNQNLYLLTPRAQKYKGFVDAEYGPNRQLQLEMTADGKIMIIGIPAGDFFTELKILTEQRGIQLIKDGD
ncbi:MAG: 4Fe-4S single cluster domain-containing protein [Bacillota bacterium]|nr:4Fe-4S single cluster domain-containing protein [Bacillota bacterium]